MGELSSWGVIGPGNVGGDLIRQITQPHVAARLEMEAEPAFIQNSTGLYDANRVAHPAGNLANLDEFPDVTFLAMPSTDDGNIAADYISEILDRGKIAVTAEKGAMANHFERMRDESNNFQSLGFLATVGGGTHLLEIGERFNQDSGNITQIHMALNGTLAAIMSSIGQGRTLGQAVGEAVALGYAEPGAQTPQDVIKGEAEGDIPKKTSIAFNSLGLGKPLDWHDLRFVLEGDEIDRAVEEANTRRFLVSLFSELHMSRTDRCPEGDIIGSNIVDHDGWRVVSGFRDVKRNPLFHHFAVDTGPTSRIVIGLGPDESDGVFDSGGPGAGVAPTANAMIDNFLYLRRQQQTA